MGNNSMRKTSNLSVRDRILIPDFKSDSFVVLYKIKTGELIVQNIQDYIKSNISLISGKLPFDRLITQAYLPIGIFSTRKEADEALKALKSEISK